MLSQIKTVDWNIKNNVGFTAAMIAVWKKTWKLSESYVNNKYEYD